MKWVGVVLFILVFVILFSFADVTGIFSYLGALSFLPGFVGGAVTGIGSVFSALMGYSYLVLIVMLSLVVLIIYILIDKFLGK